MQCPECTCEQHRVIKTVRQEDKGIIIRIRKCMKCDFPFATEEKIREK